MNRSQWKSHRVVISEERRSSEGFMTRGSAKASCSFLWCVMCMHDFEICSKNRKNGYEAKWFTAHVFIMRTLHCALFFNFVRTLASRYVSFSNSKLHYIYLLSKIFWYRILFIFMKNWIFKKRFNKRIFIK